MSRKIIKVVLLINLLMVVSSCVFDPNFYIWRDKNEIGQKDQHLPWSGADRRAVDEYKKYVMPYSSIGYEVDIRWKVSEFRSVDPTSVRNQLDQYLEKKDLLKRWGLTYGKHSGKVRGGGAEPPYQLKIISVDPIIVMMRPYETENIKKDGFDLRHPKDSGYLNSEYVVIPYHYGITIKHQPNLLYFSPDLDILPQPLNLSKNQTTTIYWDRFTTSGAIEFTEKDGFVHTKRIANKTGKDLKKDGNYDPNYHLTLIEKEKEIMKRFKY